MANFLQEVFQVQKINAAVKKLEAFSMSNEEIRQYNLLVTTTRYEQLPIPQFIASDYVHNINTRKLIQMLIQS